MKKIIQKLLNNDIPENAYYCIYLIVGAVSFLLWNFFYNRYAATFIDFYIRDIWHIVIYLAVAIHIFLNIVDKHRNVSGLISIAAVPASVVWGILIFRFYPHVILTVSGICIAAFAAAVGIVFSVKNCEDRLKDRILTALAVGKRAATLLLAAIMLCTGVYSIIFLNVRAYSEQTIDAANQISEKNTEYAEKLLTLDNDTWNQMSNTERLAILQIATNYMCEELDIEPITVKIGAFEGYINNTRYYCNKDVVSISVATVEKAEPDANIWAVASGVYNAFQADCVEEYRKDPDSFSCDEISLYDVRSWADELGKTKNNSYWKY